MGDFFFDLEGEGRSILESLGKCSHFPFFCILGHIAVFLLFLCVLLFINAMYNNNNIIYVGVALVLFVDAFTDMGCTELKPCIDIIIDLLFT